MNLKKAVKNQFGNPFRLNFENFWLLIVVSILLNSCGSTKETTYFYEIPNIKFINNFENLEPVLRSNDLLSISVSSVNPEATEIFNVSNVSTVRSSTVSGTTAQVSGYLVDQDGFIRFPVLGKIKAAGKSKKELREEITKELIDRKLLLDPIVDIRYLNFKVSVLGEVKNPSVLTIPDEKISLLEALGLAGDITIYGRRDNVVIIREEEFGVKKFTRLDLTSKEIFDSPYYYLKSNDIVYVEANKKKVASTSMTPQWFAVILGGLSLMVISISAFTY